MRGIPLHFIPAFFTIVFLIVIVSWLGLQVLISELKKPRRAIILSIFILYSLAFYTGLVCAFINPRLIREAHHYTFFMLVIAISFFDLFPRTLFSLITLVSFPVKWSAGIRKQKLLLAGATLLSSGMALVIVHGIFVGRYTVRTLHQDLHFSNLPAQFDGFKIVQISDIHFGSFGKNISFFEKAVKEINDLQPDVILFTGDIVNNFADELDGFESDMTMLQARYGKFAIPGNHDYGDYSDWPDPVAKEQNLIRLRDEITQSGFRLLLNQNSRLAIGDTAIYIAGVENWSRAGFLRYANLQAALAGIPKHAFTILMTHEPEHWEARVTGKTDVSLTLSGHTHGGQIGVNIAGIEFSPIWFMFREWAGLYRSGDQFLYVNRGMGTVGFSGRIEINPEITVLTLFRSKNR
jgi:hypothetical protein